mgnify:CR=1 FL=1
MRRIYGFQSTFPLQGTTKPDHGRWDYQDHFNPRSHCRERPMSAASLLRMAMYFNPRSHCRERPDARTKRNGKKRISIHVPIAGNDANSFIFESPPLYFNPRSHCRERLSFQYQGCRKIEFQSTFPLQGTTVTDMAIVFQINISIHVPIAGNDISQSCEKYLIYHFNPRSHCRERP